MSETNEIPVTAAITFAVPQKVGCHKATQVALSLLDDVTGQLTSKAVELALDGDTTALRLCLERICPPRKDTPVNFTLPDIEKATDAVGAAAGSLALEPFLL